MTTTITMTAFGSGYGAFVVTASADFFTADHVGRLIRLKCQAPERVANTVYGEGNIRFANDRGVHRAYRCVHGGTSAVANMAGTAPDYDLNTPNLETEDVVDDGVIWKYLGRGKSVWSWGTITSLIDAQNVNVDISPNAPVASSDPCVAWNIGAWGGASGYPRAVAIYNQRTWWFSTATQPQTAWSSMVNDFETMTPTEPDGSVLDTNAITETIDDDELQTITWALNQGQGIVLGTPSGEFLLGPSVTTASLGPSNVKIARKGARGSIDEAPAVRAGDALLFVQRGGKIERELTLDAYSEHGTTTNISILSEHITGAGVVDTARSEAPLGMVWHVRSDGLLCAITYDQDQKIRAWTRHQLAAGAIVESIASVPGPAGADDDLYLSVLRTIDGEDVRWIEVIRATFRAVQDGAAGGFFVDAGLSYDGAPATTFSGLDHLEGQTVSVRADNVDLGSDFTVSGGAVTIETPASVVHIGLPFTSRLVTLPVEAGAEPGATAQGRVKRASEVILRLHESQGGTFGRGAVLEPITESAAGGALYTGDSREIFPAGFDRLDQITVQHAGNGPMTVLAIIQQLVTNG